MKPKLTIQQRLKILKKQAKKRKISVNLNENYYAQLLDLNCIYCGDTLHDKGGYCLDRLDNSKGYTNENSNPCCGTCNKAKGKMSSEEFIDWVQKAYKYQMAIMKRMATVENPDKYERKCNNIVKNSRSYKNAPVISINGVR